MKPQFSCSNSHEEEILDKSEDVSTSVNAETIVFEYFNKYRGFFSL